MPTITTEDIADLITSTQRDLGRMKFGDIASDLQEYVAMTQLLKKERVEFGSGRGVQWNLVTDSNGQFRWTGLFEVDDYNINDVTKTANLPWRHCNVNYSIEDREVVMNGEGPNRVVELVKIRRFAAMLDMAKGWENAFWSKPATSSDVTTLYGIDMPIVKNATEGFNGGNPSGFTSGYAGVSSSTYTRWANYTAQYVTIDRTDCIDKWKRATRKCNFKPPVEVPEYGSKGQRFGFYTNDDVISTLDRLLEDQNENLGNDLYSKEGSLMFKRVPVVWVPKLDSDTQDPIYGINWNKLKFCFLKGEYMNEHKPRMAPNQHRTHVVDIDCSAQAVAYDRRSQFILNIA